MATERELDVTYKHICSRCSDPFYSKDASCAGLPLVCDTCRKVLGDPPDGSDVPQLRHGKGEAVKPTIGRIVHYKNLGDADGKYPPSIQAAVVTGVYDDDPEKVDLKVMYRTGIFDCFEIQRGDGRGQWNWPERDERSAANASATAAS